MKNSLMIMCNGDSQYFAEQLNAIIEAEIGSKIIDKHLLSSDPKKATMSMLINFEDGRDLIFDFQIETKGETTQTKVMIRNLSLSNEVLL